jgi:hypothetical protein
MSRAVATLLFVAACFDPPPPPGDFVESHTEQFEIPEFSPPNFDVLVVVDDTPAMAPYQAHLAQLPNDLIAQLKLTYGGMPNMHIAVTTSSSGGALRTTPGMSDAYLSDALQFDGTRTVNYQGAIEDVLASLMAVGTASTSMNAPLASLVAALSAPGFVRPDAYAGIVVVTASEDQDGHAAVYAGGVKQAYYDPYSIVVGGIYPPGSTNLDTFFNSFPNRGSVASIDNADWSPAYALFGRVIRVPLSGLRCSPAPLDVDPATPGDQLDCHIAYVIDDVEHAMPECVTSGARPCWKYVVDNNNCGFEDYRLFVIDGFPDPYHPAIRGECVVK